MLELGPVPNWGLSPEAVSKGFEVEVELKALDAVLELKLLDAVLELKALDDELKKFKLLLRPELGIEDDIIEDGWVPLLDSKGLEKFDIVVVVSKGLFDD